MNSHSNKASSATRSPSGNENPWIILAEKYFEGLTSEAEERELASFLAGYEGRNELLKQTRATMSYFMTMKTFPDSQTSVSTLRTRRASKWRHIAAASISIPAAAVIALFFTLWSPQATCYASVGGEKITDKNIVISMMNDQLEELEAASSIMEQTFGSDLDALANHIND